MRIDRELAEYINAIGDRGHFDAVQVAPSSSADVPDEPGGVRAVVLGVAHPHTGREGSGALAEAGDILLQRGSAPRVYRNTLVFLAAEARQVDSLRDAVRAALAWAGIVRDTERLNLTQSDSALARAKSADADETVRARLRECWCHLIYPYQESAQTDVAWSSGRVAAQDGLLHRASRELVSKDGLMPELGPKRLDRELQRYIWNGKPHLALKDIWEYLNRYTYLPRLRDRDVLVKAVQAAVAGMLPGPFAYAQGWDEEAGRYPGLIVELAGDAHIVIDDDSVIVRPDVAENHRPAPATEEDGTAADEGGIADGAGSGAQGNGAQASGGEEDEKLPDRFIGTVMISSERPARDMHRIVEAIVEELTTLPGSDVSLKLEIDAEVPAGLDRAKVRMLMENATTLGFIDKVVKS